MLSCQRKTRYSCICHFDPSFWFHLCRTQTFFKEYFVFSMIQSNKSKPCKIDMSVTFQLNVFFSHVFRILRIRETLKTTIFRIFRIKRGLKNGNLFRIKEALKWQARKSRRRDHYLNDRDTSILGMTD